MVLDTDPVAARALGRPAVDRPYLHLSNYTSNLCGWAGRTPTSPTAAATR